ncbi:MAG TPA: tetratricopeptide repeat protein, partial [Burkholderiales bacterium]|nr:tetratricopeptide repeat protein [Burkholderiales bacterium]
MERARQQYLDAGDQYFSQQKYDAALIEYRNSVKQDPAFGEARRALAETYFKLGQPERGFKEYMRAADLLPDRADVQVRAGNLLLLSGQFDGAKQRAEQVLAKHPKDVSAQVLLGNALAGLQDIEGAFAQVEEALSLDPKNSVAYGSLAVLELTRGNHDRAEAAFLQAVKLSPTSSTPKLALGNFYWSTGNFGRAETALKEASALDAKDPLPRRALALLYLTNRRPADAEPHLQALAQDPTDAPAAVMLADYYTLVGKPDRAKATIESLEKARGESAATRLRMARLAYEEGDRKGALEIVERVLASEPNQFDALMLHGRWLLLEGRSAEALMRGKAAAAGRPKSAAAHYLMGASMAARGRSDLALGEFTQVLTLNPYATAARVEIARIYMEDGATEAALRVAEEARRIDPNSGPAQLAHARVLLLRRDFRRAEPVVRSLAAAYPKSAQTHALLGAWHLLKDDSKNARVAFERAAAIDGKLPEAVAGLVRLDIADGRTAEAKARVERISKENTSPDMLMLAAATYLAAGATSDAEAALKRVLEISPTHMEAYAMLGRLYIAQNRTDAAAARLTGGSNPSVGEATMAALLSQVRGNQADARQRYQQILKDYPRAPVAANNLAWLYATTGEQLEDAARLAQTAYEEMPRNAQVANTLGYVYLKKDLPSLAVAPLEQSVARAPANPTYQYHLGLAYAGTRQFSRARTAFGRALELDPDGPHVQEIRTALAALPIES